MTSSTGRLRSYACSSATLHAAVEPGEQHLDGAVLHANFFQQRGDGDTAPARRPDSLEQPRLTDDMRLDVHSTVAGALHRHRDLHGRPRTQVVERQRLRPFHQAADVEAPRRRVDIRDVVVREEVVQADRRDVPAQRLERYSVVPRCELELLEADPLGHVPSTLTARAATSRTVTAERPDSRPISTFARRESGMVSVGLNAIEFVRET